VTVAVVGLGAMGSRIAARLLGLGHHLIAWNRSSERLQPLLERGATAAKTPADAAMRADVLITCVADAAALAAVSEGPDGIVAGAGAALTVLEMSTVGPGAVAELARGLPAGTRMVDAPVLGGLVEAEAGCLTIFAGGDAAAVGAVRPLLEQLGTVVAVGPLGSGAAAKLVANAALLGIVALLGETLSLARALGLPDDVVYDVLATTPLARQAGRRRDAIAAGEYPPRFALALARKDAELIDHAARTGGRELRLLEATRSWLTEAEAAGLGGSDYTAMLAHILGERATTASGPEGSRRLDYDGLIVDLDGVVWLGGAPIAGAVEAVAALRARGTRLVFLTNDPSNSREEQAQRLAAIGVAARAEDVITSASATARYLASRSRSARRTFVIGSSAFKQEIADAGLQLVAAAEARNADIVVVGGYNGFDFSELRAATRAVSAGAALFAAGRDRTVPTSDGPDPATGAILAAVEAATGVAATVVGKPEPFMFHIAREILADCERIAVVGDNLDSDIAGAKRAGLDAILVLTGIATEADVQSAQYLPHAVLTSLDELASRLHAAAAGIDDTCGIR
jgi:HAD superfamily hydrolase (TIGR01450 family)